MRDFGSAEGRHGLVRVVHWDLKRSKLDEEGGEGGVGPGAAAAGGGGNGILSADIVEDYAVRKAREEESKARDEHQAKQQSQHKPRARRHTESSIPAALGYGSPSPPQHVPDPLGEMSGLAQALMSDQRRFAAAAAMQQQQQQLHHQQQQQQYLGVNARTDRLSFDSADAPPPQLYRGYSRR